MRISEEKGESLSDLKQETPQPCSEWDSYEYSAYPYVQVQQLMEVSLVINWICIRKDAVM